MAEEIPSLYSIDKKLAVLVQKCDDNFGSINEKLDAQKAETCSLSDELELLEEAINSHEMQLTVHEHRWSLVRNVIAATETVIIGIILAVIGSFLKR